MASSSSYILFSQTAQPFGTRDLWGPPGLPSGTAGSVAGLINGAIGDFPLSAFDAFQGMEFVRRDWALFDFNHVGQSAPSGLLTGAIDAAAVTADGRVFAGTVGAQNPEMEIDLDSAGGISLALADRDWNGIKNVEILLTNDALADNGWWLEPTVFVRNVVDVRVKLADSWVTEEGPPRAASIVIENVKRGEIDASDLGFLDASISFTSNGPGWGNTFAITGTGKIRLLPGDWAGGATTLDGFSNLVNDGSLTRVVVTMAGDSLFDASAVNAMTDVRAGIDAGLTDPDWKDVGYTLTDESDRLGFRFDALAAYVELDVLFAVPAALPSIGAVTLWRDGVAVETVADWFMPCSVSIRSWIGSCWKRSRATTWSCSATSVTSPVSVSASAR